jgi:hypothetical protein
MTMALRVVGAGVGRTGTSSLQQALQRLLGAPCYHMVEVFGRPDHVAAWHAGFRGDPVDFDTVFDGFAATVDFPAAGFWAEMAAAYPDALVLLSERASNDAWWKSADATIFEAMRHPAPPPMAAWAEMAQAMIHAFGMRDADDEAGARAAYERHNAAVRAGVPAERLLCWKPGDGWEPLCAALGVEVPDEPFPHANTTEDFRAMLGLDAPPT